MSRAVLSIMAGLLCALAGFRHAAVLKGDAQRLRRWVQLLGHLSLLLQEGTLTIPEALSTAGDTSQPPDLLLQTLACELQKHPRTPLDEAFAKHCPSWAEQPTLTRMFTRLGRGTQASRCLAVEQAAKELQLLADHASARADKDAKLWQTLGLIGGGCLTLLLL